MKPSHRRSILQSQLLDFVHHERMQTTPRKVKLLKANFDRLVNEAKKNTEASRRNVLATLRDERAVEKLYSKILPRLQESNSGYALSALTLPRGGDGAAQTIVMIKGAELRERKSRLAQALDRREQTEAKPKSGIRARLAGAAKTETGAKARDSRKKDSTKDTRRVST